MRQLALLRRRRFGPLFATQFFGAFNDNVYKNALVLFIAFALADELGADSTRLVILAGGVFILPYFLFSATAGQLADKYEKATLIRLIKVAEVGVMTLALVGFLYASVPVLMAVLFLMGTQSTAFGPLKYSILPQHLAEHELTAGNGLIQMGTFLAILLGTVAGGVLVATEPAGPLVVASTAVVVALVGWLASQGIPPAPAPEPALRVRLNVVTQTARILRLAFDDRTVFVGILGVSWFWVVGATYLSLVPTYTRDILGGNEHVATLLFTAFSVGIGAGSLACDRLSRGHVEVGVVPLGAAGITVLSLDLWLIGDPTPGTLAGAGAVGAGAFLGTLESWRVLVDLALLGAFGGVYIVPLYAFVQFRSAPAHRARIIAANNVLNSAFMVVSALATMGLIGMGVSLPALFGLVGLATAVVATAIVAGTAEFRRHLGAWLRGWRGGVAGD